MTVTELPTFHGYVEAAAKLTAHGLDVSVYWLQDHIKELPHTRIAGKVKFSDAHLAAIVEQHTHTPADPRAIRPAGPSRRRRGGG
ncbi:MAG TPA: hypothetical protein VGL39_27785 [Jatrophihabitantaceae bacterium]|jgi:hypothetical protein